MNATSPLLKHSAEHYHQKASQCRRLAHDIPNPSDPTAKKLIDLAAIYEGLAKAKQRKEA